MEKGHFKVASGSELYYQHWRCEADAKAVVLLVHGLGEHCARYEAVANVLTTANIAVCGFDLPGHGNSPGQAGFINSFDDFASAVMSFRQNVESWYPGKPIFLLGHSMGGLISSLVLLKNQKQFAGCILSGPAIMSPLKPGAVQMAIINLLSTLVPKVGVLQLDAAGVSRDDAVVEDYINDPLVHHGKVSARLVKELFTSMQEVQDKAETINTPMLLLHGGADSMAAPAGSEFLHQRISSGDKQLEIFDGLYHEIFNEPESPEIHAKLAAWITQRLA